MGVTKRKKTERERALHKAANARGNFGGTDCCEQRSGCTGWERKDAYQRDGDDDDDDDKHPEKPKAIRKPIL